ncbi:hypothetical protein [Kaistella daneshvariae]
MSKNQGLPGNKLYISSDIIFMRTPYKMTYNGSGLGVRAGFQGTELSNQH